MLMATMGIRPTPETVERVLIILQRNAEKIFHFLILFLKNTGLFKII